MEAFEDAKSINNNRKALDKYLQSNGFLMTPDDIGYDRLKVSLCDKSWPYQWYLNNGAIQLTTTARLLSDKNSSNLEDFESKAQCIGRSPNPIVSRTQYRTISSFGNNIVEPYMGSTGAPFGRFGPKNYYDKVFTTRHAVSGKFEASCA